MLARAVQIELAPPAERFLVHVGPVMPAALALAKRARPHLHARRGRAMHARRRGGHDELEVSPGVFPPPGGGPVGREVPPPPEGGPPLAGRPQAPDFLGPRV